MLNQAPDNVAGLVVLASIGIWIAAISCGAQQKNSTTGGPGVDEKIEVAQDSKPPTAANATSETPTPQRPESVAGAEVFRKEVLPLWTSSRCETCHTLPINRPTMAAPLSLTDYTKMKALLGNGASSISNLLVNIVRNIAKHSGGDSCRNSLASEPCVTLRKWWKAEYGDDGISIPDSTTGSGGNPNIPRVGFDGIVASVNLRGVVFGWARDFANSSAVFPISFYVDGDASSPIQGRMDANTNFGFAGHGFEFQLPGAYLDGRAHKVYAYTTYNGAQVAVGTARDFTGFPQRATAKAFYDERLAQPLAQSCSGCHGVGYDVHFSKLANPLPADGGGRTNNRLINRASGGEGHGGGNRCGGKDSSFCLLMQEWWDLEFR